MRSHIKLGRILGIKIGLHYSWLLIAFLIVFSLASNYHLHHPQWTLGLVISLAVATALCFFSSLLLHELSHSLMAKAHGLPVHEITLFALGGVSQLGKEATRAKDEFFIAIVGPLTSLLIGLLCLGAVFANGHNRVDFRHGWRSFPCQTGVHAFPRDPHRQNLDRCTARRGTIRAEDHRRNLAVRPRLRPEAP